MASTGTEPVPAGSRSTAPPWRRLVHHSSDCDSSQLAPDEIGLVHVKPMKPSRDA